MASKTKYRHDGIEYTEQELIDLANAAFHYESEDNNEAEITTIEGALQFLDDVETIGASTAVGEFMRSVNLAALPEAAAEYMRENILNDPSLDIIEEDDPDFLEFKKLVTESYSSVPAAGAPAVTELAARLMKEVEDLTTLIEIEDDEAVKAKLQKEIDDLNILIEMEN